MFDSIKSILGKVAPTIATALGGPLAGAAITALTGALGLNSNASVDEIKNAINLSGDQLVAIKRADNELKQALTQVYVQTVAIAVDDNKSARAMQNDFVNKLRLEAIRWLGIITVIVFVGCFYLYYRQDVSGNEGVLIGALVSGVIALWGIVFGFLFGTGIDKIMNYFNKDNENAIEKR